MVYPAQCTPPYPGVVYLPGVHHPIHHPGYTALYTSPTHGDLRTHGGVWEAPLTREVTELFVREAGVTVPRVRNHSLKQGRLTREKRNPRVHRTVTSGHGIKCRKSGIVTFAQNPLKEASRLALLRC